MYIILAAIINVTVKFLLLIGTSQLCGVSTRWIRSFAASAVAGLISVICMLPHFQMLNRPFWRILGFFVVSLVAFGCKRSSIRNTAVFFILTMALEGFCISGGEEELWVLLIAPACISLMCLYVSSDTVVKNCSIPVQLTFAGKNVKLTALRDTGNTLRDPITGRPVLIVGADIAEKLTGLTKDQLKKPTDTILTCGLTGVRLIPYSTIGQTNALLLALRLQDVKIGEWKGSTLVAFAPERINTFGGHQAITGGIL